MTPVKLARSWLAGFRTASGTICATGFFVLAARFGVFAFD
jgi:hypothetical protein